MQVDDDGDSGEEKEGACSEEEKEGVCSEAEKGVCGALSELSLQPFCSPHLIVKVVVAVLYVTHLRSAFL